MIGFSGAVLVASFVLARIRLGRIHRTRLLSGGALVSGISGAFFALDIGLARDIVVARRAMEIGHVQPYAAEGSGLEAIVWREWQRLRRFPQPLLVVGGTTRRSVRRRCTGHGQAGLGARRPGVVRGHHSAARRSPRPDQDGGLARCLPFSLARIKLASITVPAIVVAVWTVSSHRLSRGFGEIASQRTLSDAVLMAVATGSAGLLGRDPLDPGERRRLRGADDRHPGGRVSSRADDQPVPRLRRRLVDHRTHAARGLAMVVAGTRGHRGVDAAELDGRRDTAARQAEQQKLLEQQRKQRDAAKATSPTAQAVSQGRCYGRSVGRWARLRWAA